jgi:hypothetical protein
MDDPEINPGHPVRVGLRSLFIGGDGYFGGHVDEDLGAHVQQDDGTHGLWPIGNGPRKT